MSKLEVVALFIDGKNFAEEQMVLNPRVAADGCKMLLGFVQTTTEIERVLQVTAGGAGDH